MLLVLFADTGINIVNSCQFLSGIIGDQSVSKIKEWSHFVELLSSVAKNQLQAAFIGLTRSLQQDCIYFQSSC